MIGFFLYKLQKKNILKIPSWHMHVLLSGKNNMKLLTVASLVKGTEGRGVGRVTGSSLGISYPHILSKCSNHVHVHALFKNFFSTEVIRMAKAWTF